MIDLHLDAAAQPPRDETARLGSETLHESMACHCFELAESLQVQEFTTSVARQQMLVHALAAVHHSSRLAIADRRMLVASAWLASRVHFDLNHPKECAQMADECRQHAMDLSKMFQGYALEAMSRAQMLLGRPTEAARLRDAARAIAADLSAGQGAHALEDEIFR